MNYADPDLRDRLAAEYALGTLSGPPRRRFEQLLSDDPTLRDLTEDWELRLNLLAESAPAVEPPPHVWDQIARQIGPAPAAPPGAKPESWLDRLWESIDFWRAAAALSTAAAAALVIYVALLRPHAASEQIAAFDERLARIEEFDPGLGGCARRARRTRRTRGGAREPRR